MNAPSTSPAETPFAFETFCRQPVIRESAAAKVALLRGPIYHDDPAWEPMIKHEPDLIRFFAEIGVRLTIDATDGFAFLDQAAEGEPGSEWPKLLYRDRFSYDVTCVLVVLREWLLTQETKTREDRAPLRLEELMAQLRPFSRKKDANVEKEEKRWREAINKVVALGFLKRWKGEDAFIVRPIIRARLSIDHLKSLRESLEKHSATRDPSAGEVA
ncbi:MAG: DUF4194 domain-containing protein [Opitutaceae bacterium]|nr:DUF4194 domain-containing protein [Opitutaceae bacterium]